MIGTTMRFAAGGAFSPLSLSPALWLDAADAATITASSGAVSQWNDKSGNGRHATQAIAGAKPTTSSTTQNGLNVMSFDGGDFMDYATSLQPNGGSGLSVVVVAKRTNSTGGALLTERQSARVRAFQFFLSVDTKNYISSDGQNVSSNHTISSINYADSASAFQSTFTSISGQRIVLRINGTARTVVEGTATSLSGSAGGRIGAREGAVGLYWTGWIAELIAVPAVLTSVQIADVELYLKSKWGTP